MGKRPPPPPGVSASGPAGSGADKPIRDVRAQFARKTPQTADDIDAARAFIDGKIEMVRRDPHLSDDEKVAAIASLQKERSRVGAKRPQSRR